MAAYATPLLYILFVLAAIVLVVVILLQEGRGGGLTDALGTSGQATFGVGAAGINRFTFGAIAVFLVSALLLHVVNRSSSEESIVPATNSSAPLLPGETGAGAPPSGTNTPPAEQPK
ncbi:MAG: preprotein translocase subunit SecG [Planctomycetes bacterium]|nr:preprotein translocase subunit SecG [Planctomycetota bacterium]